MMNSKTRMLTTLFILIVSISISACGGGKASSPSNPELILATTTSTYDSGLLDTIIPVFEEQSGYTVKIVAVGTGAALTMGREGNADVLLVHAPASEVEFMNDGYGSERYLVMHNDFVIVGPTEDPAEIRGVESPGEALVLIADSGSTFASRGDDSGTHKKELSLWKGVGVEPGGEWYLETGQGMGNTLRVTSEKNAYTLTDRATYLAQKDILSLDILVEGDASLLNVYHVMIVNPELWENVNLEGAEALAEFLISSAGQEMIGEYGIEQYGQPLFFPDADKTDADLGLDS
jgi:tungstate transport system substrate-binding protein